MSKHAAGKWSIALGTVVGFNDNDEWLFISPSTAKAGDCGPAICVISHRHEANSTDTENARLIAAAPDMLDALIACYNHIKNDMTVRGIGMNARRAIESATGENIEEVVK